jgi:hypothetical protein
MATLDFRPYLAQDRLDLLADRLHRRPHLCRQPLELSLRRDRQFFLCSTRVRSVAVGANVIQMSLSVITNGSSSSYSGS